MFHKYKIKCLLKKVKRILKRYLLGNFHLFEQFLSFTGSK